MKKIVLKVSIMCEKCKTCILQIVSKFDGIKSLALDIEKSTLTVVGEVDAVVIVKKLRKAKKAVDIFSIGPEKEEEKKKDDDKKEDPKPLPPCCNSCRPVGFVYYDDGPSGCTIL